MGYEMGGRRSFSEYAGLDKMQRWKSLYVGILQADGRRGCES